VPSRVGQALGGHEVDPRARPFRQVVDRSLDEQSAGQRSVGSELTQCITERAVGDCSGQQAARQPVEFAVYLVETLQDRRRRETAS
jgi:hypothetical protein